MCAARVAAGSLTGLAREMVPKAALGAMILAKVIPLLDWAQSEYRFEG